MFLNSTNEPLEARSSVIGRLFTAAQIAAALGKSKRGVQYALAEIPALGQVLARGIPAAGWSVSSLPLRMRSSLEIEAKRRNYQNVEQLLSAPPARWEPPLPLSDVAPSFVERAVQLQRALAGTVLRVNDMTLSGGEIERLGVEDYRRVFGHAISARHFRRLLNRTLSRDGGAEDWNRLDIYLDENPARKSPAAALPSLTAGDFRELQEIIAAFANPLQPSIQEKALLWINAIERYQSDVDAGVSPRRAKKALLAFLTARAPFLASTVQALKWGFERKYRAWKKNGHSLEAVMDQRPAKSGRFRAPELTDEDKKRLLARTLECGGRVAQAWRQLLDAGGLSKGISEYYVRNPARKSYVPREIRDAIKYDAGSMQDIHHGPRRARLNGAYVVRDPNTFNSWDWFQGDDLTAPVYYFEHTDTGIAVVRSQILIMIDCRSLCILGCTLTGSPAYSAFHIRNLISYVHDAHGLPRKGFYFENGSWRSRILTGRKDELSWTDSELGLRSIGLQFRHARLARAKVIENVMGRVQDLMEGEPGYCGRDERRDHYERMEAHKRLVEAGKAEPERFFMSRAQWFGRLGAIFEQYNNEVQNGKYLPGISPGYGYEKFFGSEGLVKLPDSSRYLLANHRMKCRVGQNGIIVPFGKPQCRYKNELTGQNIGRVMTVFFNPEYPELLSVFDDRAQTVFTVPRDHDIPAMDATPEQLAEALSRNAQHDAWAKALYRAIVPHFSDHFMRRRFQPVLVDQKTARLGNEIESQRDAVTREATRQRRATVAARQKARGFGLPELALTRDSTRLQRGLELRERAERLHAMEAAGKAESEEAIQ